jgi:hypothetical protein
MAEIMLFNKISEFWNTYISATREDMNVMLEQVSLSTRKPESGFSFGLMHIG